MCGIIGIWDFESKVDKNQLSKARDLLVHRGPDDKGIFVDDHVGLAHRRLSIIDLSKAGHQPMCNEDETIWITYNGEIYNFKEIRDNLEKKGHRFKSNTDTEVIIHAYEEYGEKCLELFNGMFAFGLWDSNKKRLFLARDRLGIKPLYYYWKDKQFIFSSEMKSILDFDFVKREINKDSLNDYFSYLCIPAPNTIFKKVYKLKPGHFLVLNKYGISERKYWDLEYKEKKISEKDAEKIIIKNLKEAVRKRLVADVPLGAFLSGGIDSSTIVALMSRLTKDVKTFSIGFEGSENDELELARKTAVRYNTEHHEYVIKPAEFNLFPKLVYYADEPFADSSLIPTHLVSEIARKKVTVCLSGDGGDENFAGYERYPKGQIESHYVKIPHIIRNFIYSASKSQRYKRIFEIGLITEDENRFIKGNQQFTDSEKKSLFNFKVGDANGSRLLKNNKIKSYINKMLYFDTKVILPSAYLKKVDTASMINSLEVRTPFLDHVFMEKIASLPSKYKLHFLNKKYILKKAMKKFIPSEIIKGKKRGFNAPVNDWLKGELKDNLKHIILSSTKRGFFNKKRVQHLWEQHQSGLFDHQERLWAFLSFELWNRIYIDRINYNKILD